MKWKQNILFVLFYFLILLIAGFCILRVPFNQPLDIVEVNELIHLSAERFFTVKGELSIELPNVSFDYAILDTEGSLLYNSSERVSRSLNEAIAHRDTIVDIPYQNVIVGNAIIWNSEVETLNFKSKQIFLLLVLFSLLSLLSLLFYLYNFRKNVLLPFKKLKVFAASVARGNLDFPLEMDRNQIFGAFTESFDLMREELYKAREQERAAVKSKKELVAKLSHDIKTPIASIKAVSELMALRVASEKEREQLALIEAKADQVDDLISNLFQATLEELQELTVAVMEEDSKKLKELINQADYLKIAELEFIPECIVLLDPLRIAQVFDNIIGNAYKYAGTRLRICFALQQNMDSQETLCIEIQDFGGGVCDQELPFITSKFYRGKNADQKQGAGLGLFISCFLMQQMGGRLCCKNRADGFSVVLYLKLL